MTHFSLITYNTATAVVCIALIFLSMIIGKYSVSDSVIVQQTQDSLAKYAFHTFLSLLYIYCLTQISHTSSYEEVTHYIAWLCIPATLMSSNIRFTAINTIIATLLFSGLFLANAAITQDHHAALQASKAIILFAISIPFFTSRILCNNKLYPRELILIAGTLHLSVIVASKLLMGCDTLQYIAIIPMCYSVCMAVINNDIYESILYSIVTSYAFLLFFVSRNLDITHYMLINLTIIAVSSIWFMREAYYELLATMKAQEPTEYLNEYKIAIICGYMIPLLHYRLVEEESLSDITMIFFSGGLLALISSIRLTSKARNITVTIIIASICLTQILQPLLLPRVGVTVSLLAIAIAMGRMVEKYKITIHGSYIARFIKIPTWHIDYIGIARRYHRIAAQATAISLSSISKCTLTFYQTICVIFGAFIVAAVFCAY